MIEIPTDNEPVKVIQGDCRTVAPSLGVSFDAVVTDPPYELTEPRSNIGGAFLPRSQETKERRRGGFMGKAWDGTGVSFDPATWATILDTLKPGGYMAAFAGSRTQHRIACAIEDAGFEIRDCLLWLYGTGFPKGKGCLKPAYEPIILARRPGPKVLPLGIDECRVPTADKLGGGAEKAETVCSTNHEGWDRPWKHDDNARAEHAERVRANVAKAEQLGRWPANILHDGSEEVMEAFAAFGHTSTTGKRSQRSREAEVAGTNWGTSNHKSTEYANDPPGTAARFFYCAKASKADRGDGNTHPTVKPTDLMRWIVRLICPVGGTVLDPFAGSGSTGKACLAERRKCVLIEENGTHVEIIRKRIQPKRAELFA